MAEEPIHAAAEAPRQDLAQPAPPALASRADDLEAIRNAVVEAAGAAVGIWLSYLLALFYLLIAVAGVTHRDLFFANPVKLPFLNVDLPLKGFFWLGPALLVVLHTYVLVHFALLAGKAGVFDTELRAQIGDPQVRDRLRRQLPSNIFVQLLAGPREVRQGLMGLLLRSIAWLTVVVGPVALLILFQLQFLPYHDESITQWQRLAVAIDIGLLWPLWPSIARGEAIGKAWRGFRKATVASGVVTSIAVLLFVFGIATFPGEPLERLGEIRVVKSIRDVLIAGDVDLVTRKPRSIWSNRLVLPEIDVIDHAKFDTESKIVAIPVSVSLRKRDLRGAILTAASLRAADLTGADLRGAMLEHADLRGAKAACGQNSLKYQPLSEQTCAQFQNALLDFANMQGVALNGAQFQGASLQGAHLEGASLIKAQFMGAWLEGVSFRGAVLLGAGFEGASLDVADMQGSFLSDANLRSANLEGADLRAASLGNAQLQGADLRRVNLTSAFVGGAFVWRADASPESVEEVSIKVGGASIANVETRPKVLCQVPEKVFSEVCGWSKPSYEDLKKRADLISRDDLRQKVKERIERLDPTKPFEGESMLARRWLELERSSPATSAYERGLTVELIRIGCEQNGAPYVVDAMAKYVASPYGPFVDFQHSQQLAILEAAFQDKEHCPGARYLSEFVESPLKGKIPRNRR